MARLLILVAILVAILWVLNWFRKTPAPQVSRVLRKSVIWGGIALLLVALASGRLSPALAAIGAALGAAVPLVIRVANLLRLWPVLQQLLRTLGLGGLPGVGQGAGAGPGGSGPGGAGAHSRIRTRFLEVRLSHATGAMDGEVLEGPFQGSALSDLALDDLLRMHELYRDADAQSLAVLEAYLDREHGPDWRACAGAAGGTGANGATGAGGGAHGSFSPGGRLNESEAWSILGLEPGADAAAIRTAHRRLMQRLHPDRGGSDYLAAKINEAKRLLLRE